MTVEHMSRVSDIGGVLLQYLRCAMFFWHRYHEDVQPRQARVQMLSDQTKQASSSIMNFRPRSVGITKLALFVLNVTLWYYIQDNIIIFFSLIG